MTHISTTHFTNVHEAYFNSIFSSTYENYRLLIRYRTANAGGQWLAYKLASSGVAASESVRWHGYDAGSYVIQDTTFGMFGNLAHYNNPGFMVVDICSPFKTRYTTSSSDCIKYQGQASQLLSIHQSNGSFDGIQMFIRDAYAYPFVVDATISVYGYKD
jgi:hypothetical protein